MPLINSLRTSINSTTAIRDFRRKDFGLSCINLIVKSCTKNAISTNKKQSLTTEIKTSKLIYDVLSKNLSTAYIFYGGNIMTLLDHFHEQNNYNKMQYFVPSSEMSAGFCSLGHNKAKNKCDSVIITTSDPGLTNVLTPLTDAYYDDIPLLVISGDVSTEMQGKNVFQSVPVLELTKAITYWNYSLNKTNEIFDVLSYALMLVKNGKQVHLNIPKDILNQNISNFDSINILKRKHHFLDNLNGKNIKVFSSDQIKDCDSNIIKPLDIETIQKDLLNQTSFCKTITPPLTIENIAEIINKSIKPVLYVGRGCINGSNELRQLAVLSQIPVTTTIHGLGIFEESHYLSLKMLGIHGSIRANQAIQNADCIICVGARFDDQTVGNINKYAPNAKHIIHINSNKNVFNKIISNSINIHGLCEKVLPELLKYITPKESIDWFKELNQYRIDFPYDPVGLKQQDILLLLDKLLDQLNLKDKLLITSGVGNHQMYAAQLLTHLYPNRFITSGSLGSMSSANSMAIGVKIAYSNFMVISIDDNQSFNMVNDLKMILNYNIAIKIIIMNDSKHSMVNIWKKLFFNNNIVTTETINPDYNILAYAYNIKCIEINKSMNLSIIEQQIRYFLHYDIDKPIILNCIIDSDFCLPLIPPGNTLNDMLTYHTYNDHKKNKFKINRI
jgi:acetolactate synthase-1/2/3 large subunit